MVRCVAFLALLAKCQYCPSVCDKHPLILFLIPPPYASCVLSRLHISLVRELLGWVLESLQLNSLEMCTVCVYSTDLVDVSFGKLYQGHKFT